MISARKLLNAIGRIGVITRDVVVGHGQVVHDAHVSTEVALPGLRFADQSFVQIEQIAAIDDKTRPRRQGIDFLDETGESLMRADIPGNVRVRNMHEDVVLFAVRRGLQFEINTVRERFVLISSHVISRRTRDVDEYRILVGLERVAALCIRLNHRVAVRDRYALQA